MNKARNSKHVARRQEHREDGDRSYTMYAHVAPVATRLRTWLKYSEILFLTTPGSGYGVYDWNLNGLFDPNRTGTGHQPRGFDQLAALYQRYRVYRAKYQFICISQLQSTQSLIAACATNAAAPGAINDIIELGGTVKPFTGSQPGVIAGSVDLVKLNGKSHQAYMSDDTTQALVSANPTEILVLHTAVNDQFGASTYQFCVSIWFDCEFSDPVQLAQS